MMHSFIRHVSRRRIIDARLYSTGVRGLSYKSALVIGNDPPSASNLTNESPSTTNLNKRSSSISSSSSSSISSCAKDATDVHNVLTSIGFDSELLTNVSGKAFRHAILGLAAKRRANDVCLLYCSGHGVERFEHNYFMNITGQTGEVDKIPINRILGVLCNVESCTTVIISDSSRVKRDKPLDLTGQIYASGLPWYCKFLFEFATHSNKNNDDDGATTTAGSSITSDDGATTTRSSFTSYLLPYLGRKDMDLESILASARKEMKREEKGLQTFSLNSLGPDVPNMEEKGLGPDEPLFLSAEIVPNMEEKERKIAVLGIPSSLCMFNVFA